MSSSSDLKPMTWEATLQLRLPEFGHRNWIVIADSAYPAQSNPGIETIATTADHLQVLEKTFLALSKCKHVRANVYIDAELKAVSEEDAPGVTEYRRALDRVLEHADIREVEHEQIISKLDAGGKLFRVLILKSTFTIPYTSVFLELDCGYWSADAEQRLRSSLLRA